MEVAGVDGHYKVVEAAKPYAKIGDVNYDSFQAALDAVQNGEKIEILNIKIICHLIESVHKILFNKF